MIISQTGQWSLVNLVIGQIVIDTAKLSSIHWPNQPLAKAKFVTNDIGFEVFGQWPLTHSANGNCSIWKMTNDQSDELPLTNLANDH